MSKKWNKEQPKLVAIYCTYQISSDQTTLKSMYSLKTAKTLSWLSLGLTHIIQSSQKNEWSGSSTQQYLYWANTAAVGIAQCATISTFYVHLYAYMVCLILIAFFLGLYFFLLQALITFLGKSKVLFVNEIKTMFVQASKQLMKYNLIEVTDYKNNCSCIIRCIVLSILYY